MVSIARAFLYPAMVKCSRNKIFISYFGPAIARPRDFIHCETATLWTELQGSFLGNPVDELAVSHPESAKKIEEPMMGNMGLLWMMLYLSRDRPLECTPTSRDRSVGYSTTSLCESNVHYRV